MPRAERGRVSAKWITIRCPASSVIFLHEQSVPSKAQARAVRQNSGSVRLVLLQRLVQKVTGSMFEGAGIASVSWCAVRSSQKIAL